MEMFIKIRIVTDTGYVERNVQSVPKVGEWLNWIEGPISLIRSWTMQCSGKVDKVRHFIRKNSEENYIAINVVNISRGSVCKKPVGECEEDHENG